MLIEREFVSTEAKLYTQNNNINRFRVMHTLLDAGGSAWFGQLFRSRHFVCYGTPPTLTSTSTLDDGVITGKQLVSTIVEHVARSGGCYAQVWQGVFKILSATVQSTAPRYACR